MAFELAEPNLFASASKVRASLDRDLCNPGTGVWRREMAGRMTLLCPERPSSIPRRHVRQLGSWCCRVSEAATVKRTGFR